MRRRPLLLVPFFVVALLLAGCGSDDGADDAATTTEDDATESEASTPTDDDEAIDATDDDGDDPPEDDDPTTTTARDTSGDHEFCAGLDRVNNLFAESSGNDLDQARQSIAAVVDELADILPDAPDELAGPLSNITDLMDEVQEIADEAATFDEYQAGVSGLFSEQDETDGDAIQAWIVENCPSQASE